MKNKIDHVTTKQLIITKDFPLGKKAYLNAPIVVKAATDDHYAGIAFHNPNREAAALYLQDGYLVLMKNTGEHYKIQMEFWGKTEE